MTEPTDAELEALAVEHEAFGFGLADKQGLSTHGFDPDGLRSFARAVLAKFGTPPAVAGEPVAEVISTNGPEAEFTCEMLHGHVPALGAVVYLTPQPTQAQAGAPLVSPEQWQALFDDQKRLVELANSRAEIAERMLKATQAQAGAVPLPQEPLGAEFQAVLDKHRFDLYAEADKPGIKGGQHGAAAIRKLKEDTQ